MQLTFDADVEAFRAEFVAFLDQHLPEDTEALERSRSSSHIPQWARHWQRLMFDHGWLLPGNPPEFGGRNATILQQYVHQEELARRRAYLTFNPQGVGIVSASLISFGTPDQQRRWAVPILRAEMTASLGMSEPGAGSDLASLSTKAVRDGDEFVVSGQKVWTSGAHDADVLLTFVRTDPNAPKHKGISAFILDMSAPGVSVRPLRELTGTSDFNEVFFDGVEVSADAMIGAPGQGWAIANATLAHERTNVGGIVVKLRLAVDGLVDLARLVTIDGCPAIESDRVRDRIGQFSADVEALSALTYANLTRWLRGGERMHDAAMGKLMFSEINLEIAQFAVELSGEAGVLVEGDDNVVDHGRWQDEWLYARAYTIAGGSSEIMRNLIAERGLGLPRK